MSSMRSRFSRQLRPVVNDASLPVSSDAMADRKDSIATTLSQWWTPDSRLSAQAWSDQVLQVFVNLSETCAQWQTAGTWPCALRDPVLVGDFWMADLLIPAGLYRLVLSRVPMADRLVEWQADDKLEALSPCQGLGSRLALHIPTLPGTVHLQFLDGLGCFFLQPLVLNLQRYVDIDAVFAARASVLTYRQAKREAAKAATQCTRRGFFARLAGTGPVSGVRDV